MGGIGFGEIIVVLIVALVVLGPDKLPEYAQMLGKALGDFKKYTSEATKGIREELVEPLNELQKPLKEAMEPITEIQNEFQGIGQDIRKEMSGIQQDVQNMSDDIQKDVKGIGQDVQDNLSEVKNAVDELGQQLEGKPVQPAPEAQAPDEPGQPQAADAAPSISVMDFVVKSEPGSEPVKKAVVGYSLANMTKPDNTPRVAPAPEAEPQPDGAPAPDANDAAPAPAAEAAPDHAACGEDTQN